MGTCRDVKNGLGLTSWSGTGLILPSLGLGLIRETITVAWPDKGLELI